MYWYNIVYAWECTLLLLHLCLERDIASHGKKGKTVYYSTPLEEGKANRVENILPTLPFQGTPKCERLEHKFESHPTAGRRFHGM